MSFRHILFIWKDAKQGILKRDDFPSVFKIGQFSSFQYSWECIKFANGWIQTGNLRVMEVTALQTEPLPLPMI